MCIKKLPLFGCIICVICIVTGLCFENSSSPLVEYYSQRNDVRYTTREYQRTLWQELGWSSLDIKNMFISIYESATDRVDATSVHCFWDLVYLFSSIKEQWALEMLDSIGKLQSGLLNANLMWIGNYDECLDVLAPAGIFSPGFTGQYCLATFQPKIKNDMKIALKIGICLPNSCNSTRIMNSYNKLALILDNIPVVNKIMQKMPLTAIRCIPETVKWSKSAIGCLTLIVFLASIVIVATLFDLLTRHNLKQRTDHSFPQKSHILPKKSTDSVSVDDGTSWNDDDSSAFISTKKPNRSNVCRDLLLCFSAAKNGSSILDTSAVEGQLGCLHGIRFLSMTWVIMGHTAFFGATSISNPMEAVKFVDTRSFEAILQAFFSVDSFFLLSGFLLTYIFLKSEKSPKSIGQWIYIYAHRYIRLTPVYAVVLGTWASIFLYLGSGPLWEEGDLGGLSKCSENWWWNLLYINNFSGVGELCMAWSWYLSLDMQFFIISPLFLVSLKRWPVFGIAFTSVAIFGSWINMFFLSYGYNFDFLSKDSGALQSLVDPNSKNPVGRQFMKLYYQPYCRIGPYLIGMLVAYCVLKVKDRRKSIPKYIFVIGWMTAISCGLYVIYGQYHAHFGTVVRALFTSLSRSVWAFSLGWLIFACLSGYGGPVNSLLSLKYFFPLSRLTYCVFLIHPFIVLWYTKSLKEAIYPSLTALVMLYLAILLLSYLLGFLVSLLFESPIIALEKRIRKIFIK